LDRLYFIPTTQSPFKTGSQAQPGAVRLQLLRLALAGLTWAEVDDQEVRRGGVSYTIDTVRNYFQRHPDAELYCLVGADSAASLPLWKQADELSARARFLVIPRPGNDAMSLPQPFRGSALTGIPTAISSSEIRRRIRAGMSIRHLVPGAVREAILNNRLYL